MGSLDSGRIASVRSFDSEQTDGRMSPFSLPSQHTPSRMIARQLSFASRRSFALASDPLQNGVTLEQQSFVSQEANASDGEQDVDFSDSGRADSVGSSKSALTEGLMSPTSSFNSLQ